MNANQFRTTMEYIKDFIDSKHEGLTDTELDSTIDEVFGESGNQVATEEDLNQITNDLDYAINQIFNESE